METPWLIKLACCLFQHSCSERLDRQELPAVTQTQHHWLIETGKCSWSKAPASRSHPAVHRASKVYHPMIRLINETAVEQRTWLKCKYPQCKWLNWIVGNYKLSSRELLYMIWGVVKIRADSLLNPFGFADTRQREPQRVSSGQTSARVINVDFVVVHHTQHLEHLKKSASVFMRYF